MTKEDKRWCGCTDPILPDVDSGEECEFHIEQRRDNERLRSEVDQLRKDLAATLNLLDRQDKALSGITEPMRAYVESAIGHGASGYLHEILIADHKAKVKRVAELKSLMQNREEINALQIHRLNETVRQLRNLLGDCRIIVREEVDADLRKERLLVEGMPLELLEIKFRTYVCGKSRPCPVHDYTLQSEEHP